MIKVKRGKDQVTIRHKWNNCSEALDFIEQWFPPFDTENITWKTQDQEQYDCMVEASVPIECEEEPDYSSMQGLGMMPRDIMHLHLIPMTSEISTAGVKQDIPMMVGISLRVSAGYHGSAGVVITDHDDQWERVLDFYLLARDTTQKELSSKFATFAKSVKLAKASEEEVDTDEDEEESSEPVEEPEEAKSEPGEEEGERKEATDAK